MLKPGPSYKMSKQGKRTLAQYLDSHKRGEVKRSIIQAELAALIQPKRERNRREGQNDNGSKE
jgi:hypothetical protein